MRFVSKLGLLVVFLSTLGLGQQWWQNHGEPADETLFVYGTLTSPLIRFATCRCLTPSEPLTIYGYTVESRNLLPTNRNVAVHGEVLQVTETELDRFDRYERVPDHYVRVRRTFGGTEAWIYLKTETAISTANQ